MAKMSFDSSEISTANPYEILPDGTKCRVVIEKSEMKSTKAGDGKYLAIEIVVIDGPHEGKRLFENLNLENKNEQAVAIANRTLSQICHATGKIAVEDSDELHGIPMIVTLGIEQARGTFEARNKVKKYEADEAPKPKTTPEGAPKTAPWAKRA